MAGNNPNMLAIVNMIEKGANPKEVAMNIANEQLGLNPEQFIQQARTMGFNV